MGATVRKLILDGNIVVNVVEVDPDADWDPGEGLTVHPAPDEIPVGPGWIVASSGGDGAFTPPEPPNPPDPPELTPTLVERVAALEAAILGGPAALQTYIETNSGEVDA